MSDSSKPQRENRLLSLVGCPVPVQLAAMGGVSTSGLVGAVSAAGGLGMLSGTGLPVDYLRAEYETAAALGGADGVVGVGFLMPFFDVATFETAAALAPLVECFYGEPSQEIVQVAHDNDALVSWQVGSFHEAMAAVEAGCDILVVQGIEAGGHVRGNQPLLDVLDLVRTELNTQGIPVPLIGAGGIGNVAQAQAVCDAGADGVRLGTVFLAATEANVHPGYLAALVAAQANDTVLTEAFSQGWPNAPHRVLRSALEASDAAPETRSVFPPTKDFDGEIEAMALYAGMSVDGVTKAVSAAEIIDQYREALV